MSKHGVNTLITSDSTKYNKDCKDFCCLRDGTLTGDYKYCNFSKLCQQSDIDANGQPVPIESHICPVVIPITNQIIEYEQYCTGMHDLRSLAERIEGDDKIS